MSIALFGKYRIMRSPVVSVPPVFSGGPAWSPRNNSLQTPPGPEGSNGSSIIVCRGVAGLGHLQSKSPLLSYNSVITLYNGI